MGYRFITFCDYHNSPQANLNTPTTPNHPTPKKNGTLTDLRQKMNISSQLITSTFNTNHGTYPIKPLGSGLMLNLHYNDELRFQNIHNDFYDELDFRKIIDDFGEGRTTASQMTHVNKMLQPQMTHPTRPKPRALTATLATGTGSWLTRWARPIANTLPGVGSRTVLA